MRDGLLDSQTSVRQAIYRPSGKPSATEVVRATDAWYCEEGNWPEEDQDQEEDYNEASYQEGDGEEYEDQEVSQSETIALNCLEELESSEAGHAVQLQLAARAASGKAKCKGKKGSPKAKVRARARGRSCVVLGLWPYRAAT